jgi:hypothetical protein
MAKNYDLYQLVVTGFSLLLYLFLIMDLRCDVDEIRAEVKTLHAK